MKNKISLPTHHVTLIALIVINFAGPLCAAVAGTRDFYFPSTGVRSEGRALLLAIDDQLLPLRDNVVEHLSKPKQRKEPVLSPSSDDPLAPDQVGAHFYGAVIRDNGRFRMWYYAVGLKGPGDARLADLKQVSQGPVCYAESDDGLTWTKPVLNQIEFKGSRKNNAVALPDKLIEGVHVIKEDDEPDATRRYKMVYNTHNGKTWVFRTATSADGVRWQAAPEFALKEFLETAGLYKFNDTYFVHGQRLAFSEGGNRGGRQGRGVLSPDFNQWLPGDTQGFNLPEPADPAARGQTKPYDQVHLGVGAASFGSVCVGLYGIWHNAPGDESSQKVWGWFGYGRISCDLGLVISNDGMRFREPVKGHVFISRFDAPATPVPGKDYPTILAQSGNGILNVGDETRIYFGRWRNADYGQGYLGEIALATLPRDRWGAVGLFPAGPHGGEIPSQGFIWSAPVRLPDSGCTILLNADHASLMDIEISDDRFGLLPTYAGAQAGRVTVSGGLDCPVAWSADLAALAGRTVRFKINLRRGADGSDPRLFAVTLQAN
jgi:hypothetical protein